MIDLCTAGVATEACEREQHEALNTIAATCPSCESHNVSDPTGLGQCDDCGLTDNLSAFMGGGMTANAKFAPSKFAKGTTGARKFIASAPRGWTISGGVD